MKRPRDHAGYVKLWGELVALMPWKDAAIEGPRTFIPRIEGADFKRRCPEFIRQARAFFTTDLYGLMRWGLSHGDRIHEEIGARWLDQPWLFDKVTRFDHLYRTGNLHGVWLEWSRRHWKTTTIQAWCQKLMLENGDLVFRYFSRTIPMATERMGDIKKELEENKLLQRLFPERFYQDPSEEASDWSDHKFTIKRTGRARAASAQPTMSAHGIIGGVGAGAGVDVVIFDDIEEDANAHKLEQIMKTSRNVRQALKAVNPGSKFRLTVFSNTRYSASGPMARLHEDGFVKNVWVESAVDWDQPNEDYDKDGLDIGGHEPVLLTAPELKEFRGEGEGPRRDYWLQFLCRVEGSSVRALDSRRMGTFETPPDCLPPMNYYILMDPGGTPGTSPSSKLDDTAIWVIGLGKDQQMRIVDGVLDMVDQPTRSRLLMMLHRRWSARGNVVEVRIEECGTGGDCSALAAWGNREGYVFDIVRIAWGGAHSLSKKVREHRYIDGVIDSLHAPAQLHRRRRDQVMCLVKNLRVQMDTLVETEDDHPLDALALIGTPPEKRVKVYRGSRIEERDLGGLKWPSPTSRYVVEERRSLLDSVPVENRWMLSGFGVGALSESFVERTFDG